MTARFEINARNDDKFGFVLKSANGQVILVSQGYTTKAACQAGIQSVRAHASVASSFSSLAAKNGSPYFTMLARNGQVIGQSQMYGTTTARDNGIRAVMTSAPLATVVDNTRG
jgi:uncharacterized protein YegP (UPF0339 family)